jgi:hypothetical protein
MTNFTYEGDVTLKVNPAEVQPLQDVPIQLFNPVNPDLHCCQSSESLVSCCHSSAVENEPQSYSVEPDTFFKQEKTPKPITVHKISHLLPINCHCTVGDEEMILTAYIDYSTRKVEVPTYTLDLIGDRTDTFEMAIHDFLESQDHEVARKHEAEFATVAETPAAVTPKQNRSPN